MRHVSNCIRLSRATHAPLTLEFRFLAFGTLSLDIYLVDNGTRALSFYDQRKNVTQEHSRMIGYTNGN